MTLPDRFIDHDTQARQLIDAGLTAKDIIETALRALGHRVDSPTPKAVTAR